MLCAAVYAGLLVNKLKEASQRDCTTIMRWMLQVTNPGRAYEVALVLALPK